MNNVQKIPREHRNFDFNCEVSYRNLETCFLHLEPTATSEIFVSQFVSVTANKDDPRLEDPIEIISQFVSPQILQERKDDLGHWKLGPLAIGLTHLFRAKRAMDAGKPDLAWSYMSDSRYWAGVAISGKSLLESIEFALTAKRSVQGKAGAENKSMKYERVRDFAYELVEKKRPQSGWKSRNQAVLAIRDDVLAFSKSNPDVIELKEGNPERTLHKWLKEMPNASELFPVKPGASEE